MRVPAALFLSSLWLATSAFSTSDPRARDLLPLYYELHQSPELSFHETKTAAHLARELSAISGMSVTSGVGGNGVVGVLKNGDGPTVLLRTELDALPIAEETGLPYASHVTATLHGKKVGVMHACGHDVHMTVWTGTARWLAAHRDAWRGTAVFVGQPAEERTSGAARMLDDGLYTRFPKPDFALALHVASNRPAGTVAYRAGEFLASDTPVRIHVKGKSGHGAMPSLAVDPIVLGSELVLDLQTIVSREQDPLDPVVITVGTFQAGTKANVIPDSAELGITVRTLRPETTKRVLASIERHAKALAEAHDAPAPEIHIGKTSPPLSNEASLVDKVVPALRKALGSARVSESPISMASEDFGEYHRGGVPILMYWLGAVDPDTWQKSKTTGETLPSLHSSRFAPQPELTIETGVRAMTAAVTELLPSSVPPPLM